MDKALECLRESLEIRRQINDPIGEAETLLSISAVERDRGDLAATRTTIEAALTVTEAMRAKIRTLACARPTSHVCRRPTPRTWTC